jgi:guanosine-3',5'-bis(diphosphate) 3'-pyrophosphohydrolase
MEAMPSSSNKTIEDILDVAKSYLHEESNLDLIHRAYLCAKKMHEGQFRRSGDPYVQHPIEVAYLLATLHTGPSTIAAGLLHDVLEDTSMTIDEMRLQFGDDVTNIVDGVTKIGKLKYMTKEKALAHNHEKLLLAMAKDIRVVLVKLVDRLHNMRTIKFHTMEKQIRISKETLDLYAPLALRLGMYRLKAELEDLSFGVLYPDEYKNIQDYVFSRRSERQDDIDYMIKNIESMLDTHQIKGYEVKGRIKNIYSIYRKLQDKHKTLDDIYDLLALRVIVNSVAECYQVLGLIHSIWTPLPMRFKDYIAVPKSNLYQSLHTTVVGRNGKIFEIQIRTYDMDSIAELGVAAHWAYKENSGYSHEKEQLEITNKLKWYKDLTTYVENASTEDPLDSIIADIFSANVYVFSPNGDVYDFPVGSMPLDFAYRIHSQIGEHTVGALANGKIVSLNYKMKTGDVIEIKTSKTCMGPTSSWLKFAKTNHARTKIKAFINKQQRDQVLLEGKESFERVAKTLNYDTKLLTDEVVERFFNKENVHTLDEFYWNCGKGVISCLGAVNRICGITDVKLDDAMALKQYSEDNQQFRKQHAHNGYGIIVDGLAKVQVKLASCCQPVYGDHIYGYVTKANGIVVHREGCKVLSQCERDRFINLAWDQDFTGRVFVVTIKVLCHDHLNVVADMINALNACNVSILSVTSSKNKLEECLSKFKLQVSKVQDVDHVVQVLTNFPGAYSVERMIKL